MFDGKRFFPETGTPIRKRERSRTLFAVCEPEPFAVATWREKSLTVTADGTLVAGDGAVDIRKHLPPTAAGLECARVRVNPRMYTEPAIGPVGPEVSFDFGGHAKMAQKKPKKPGRPAPAKK